MRRSQTCSSGRGAACSRSKTRWTAWPRSSSSRITESKKRRYRPRYSMKKSTRSGRAAAGSAARATAGSGERAADTRLDLRLGDLHGLVLRLQHEGHGVARGPLDALAPRDRLEREQLARLAELGADDAHRGRQPRGVGGVRHVAGGNPDTEAVEARRLGLEPVGLLELDRAARLVGQLQREGELDVLAQHVQLDLDRAGQVGGRLPSPSVARIGALSGWTFSGWSFATATATSTGRPRNTVPSFSSQITSPQRRETSSIIFCAPWTTAAPSRCRCSISSKQRSAKSGSASIPWSRT